MASGNIQTTRVHGVISGPHREWESVGVFGRGPGWSPGVGNKPASPVGGDSVGNNAESDEQRPGQERGENSKLSLAPCTAKAVQ